MAKFLNLLKLRGFTSPSDAAVEISAATDSASASRLRIDAGGKLTWGDGTNAGDTNLYRTVANTLKTDDYLIAQGGMTIESYQVTTVGASAGNALVFDGTKFAPGAVSGGGAAGSTYVATIGNGSATTITVTHGLNTRDVVVVVRNANSPYEVIDVQWEATSTSTVTFNFGTPPASNSVRVGIYSATTGDNVALSLDNLTDVVITAPEEFQGLSYNGTEWVNSHIPLVSYVRNVETTTITTGTCVYLFGSTGDHATVKRASNTSDTTSSKTIGVAGANIAASQNGPIITRGYVDGIDLSTGYTAGDVLWLGTNGQFTKVKPTAPDHLVFIGVVVRATNNGIIYVATQNGYELDEIHNVSLPNPQPGEFLKYNGSLWVADAIDLGTDTTGSYVQSLVAGTGITLTNNSGEGATPTIAIGQAVATNSNVTFNTLTTSASASIGGNLSVSGNLTVSGTTTSINTETLTVDDNIIVLNNNVTASPTENAGIEVERGTSANVLVRWNETNDKWEITNDGTTYGNIVNTADTGTVTSTMIADGTIVNGDINASAAISLSKLASGTAGQLVVANASGVPTYTTISGDITINSSGVATIAADSVVLGSDTTGNYVASVSAGTGVTVSGASGEGWTPTISIGQAVGTSDSPSFAGITVGGSVPAIYATMGSNKVGIGTNIPSASAQLTVKSTSTAFSPLVLQNASGQTASSQEWQNAMGSVLAYVSSTGDIFSYSTVTGASVSGWAIAQGGELASDTNLTLLYGTGGGSSPTQNASINVKRGISPTVAIRWNETTDKWQFTNDGTTYKDLGSGGITVSDTAPSTPATGDLWYESDTGSTYVYYDSYWIEIGGSTAYDQIIGTIQAKGDLLAGTASQAIARLAVGTNGTRLVADSTTATGLAWASDTQNTVIDAKGDLLVGLADNTVGKLTVGTNGQILVADSSQTTGVGWTELNTRNLLYNGSMQVAQRGASAAGVNGTNYYTVDRWQQGTSSAGTWTQTQESDGPANAGFTKSLKMLCTTAQTPLSASSILYITQSLEGQDCQAIRKGTAQAQQVTLSFWVKSNVTGTYVVSLIDDDNVREVGKTYTVNASGTWEFKTLTFPADTTGALANDNGRSLMAFFWLAAGSNYTSGTLQTSWGSITNANRAVGQVNLASAVNNYWQITGVQLNVGPVAAPFEFKSYERDLRECQRYYQRFLNGITVRGNVPASNGIFGWMSLPVQMRTAPTWVRIGTWTVSNCGQPSGSYSGTNTVAFASTATATGDAYAFAIDNSTGFELTGAEL